jgi:hypothetical protein
MPRKQCKNCGRVHQSTKSVKACNKRSKAKLNREQLENSPHKKGRAPRKGEGGQPGNRNAEKYTEEKAMKIANGLLEWLKPKLVDAPDGAGKVDVHAENILYEQYLLGEGLHPNITSNLSSRFESFREIIGEAKEWQRVKMMYMGAFKKIDSRFGVFLLSAIHGLSEKKEQTVKTEGPITFTVKPVKRGE